MKSTSNSYLRILTFFFIVPACILQVKSGFSQDKRIIHVDSLWVWIEKADELKELMVLEYRIQDASKIDGPDERINQCEKFYYEKENFLNNYAVHGIQEADARAQLFAVFSEGRSVSNEVLTEKVLNSIYQDLEADDRFSDTLLGILSREEILYYLLKISGNKGDVFMLFDDLFECMRSDMVVPYYERSEFKRFRNDLREYKQLKK